MRFLELAGLVSEGRDLETQAHLGAQTTGAGPTEPALLSLGQDWKYEPRAGRVGI